MAVAIVVLSVVYCGIGLLIYALCKVSGDADEMMDRWMEERHARPSTGADSTSDLN